MNTLIVLWILNLEEKLDDSNKRLWKLQKGTTIYHLMLQKGTDGCNLLAIDLNIATFALGVKDRNRVRYRDQYCCLTIERVVGAKCQIYHSILARNIARRMDAGGIFTDLAELLGLHRDRLAVLSQI